MSLVSDYHSRRTRSRAIGVHQTGVYAGTIGGGALAGWMGQQFGWRAPFLLLGILGCVLGVVLTVFIREPGLDEAERRESGSLEERNSSPAVSFGDYFLTLAEKPTAIFLLAAFCGANAIAGTFLAWMPTFLHEKHGLSIAEAGFMATFFVQVPSMIGAVIGGVLADSWRAMLPGGRICVQAMGTMIGVPFIYYCGQAEGYRNVLLAMACFGICKGIYDANIWPALYDVVPPGSRAFTLGLGNFLGWSSAAALVTSIGGLADQGTTMSTSISATSIIYLLVSFLLLIAGFVFAPRDVSFAGGLEASDEEFDESPKGSGSKKTF